MENVVDFIAGSFGGMAGVMVAHPLDTVKTRIQSQSISNPLYKNAWHCFSSIVRKEGPRGLYKGMTSPLYSYMGINAIVFGVQGNLIRQMDESLLTSHAISGSVAGLSQSFINGPMELVKIQMQSQGKGQQYGRGHTYSTALDCLKKIYQVEGLRGVYRGITITVTREIPAFGVYFVTYEYLGRLYSPNGTKDCPVPILMLAGGTAGSASWLCNYPIDVLKTRMQQDGHLMDGKFHYKYTGYMDCLRQSIASDGYAVFVRGLTTTLTRGFVMNAATFPVYTLCTRYMRPDNSEK